MDQAQLIETIEKMTVLELSELVKALEDKFGVSAAAPVAEVAVALLRVQLLAAKLLPSKLNST